MAFGHRIWTLHIVEVLEHLSGAASLVASPSGLGSLLADHKKVKLLAPWHLVLSACGYSICGFLGALSSSFMSSIFSNFLDLSSFLQVENSWSILFVSAHYCFSSLVPLFQARVPSLHFGCLISYFCDQPPLPNLSLSNPNSSIVWLLVSDGRGWRLLSSFLLFKSWSMPVLMANGRWIWIRLIYGLIERGLSLKI